MPRKPFGANGVVVGRVEVDHADDDEQRQHDQLDDHHDVVGRRALAGAAQQQPGDEHHDGERRHVDQDRDAGDVRRRLQQPVHRRIGAEQRRAVAGRQPRPAARAEAAEQRLEVVAPGDRHRDVADGVLEDQVPADDPGDELAERRVGVRVGAAGLRDHRGQFRVAERRRARRRRRAAGTRGPAPARRLPDDLAVRADLPGRRRADRAEDAGADHGADRQHDQVAGAERRASALAAVRCRRAVRDGFAPEELQTWPPIARRRDVRGS